MKKLITKPAFIGCISLFTFFSAMGAEEIGITPKSVETNREAPFSPLLTKDDKHHDSKKNKKKSHRKHDKERRDRERRYEERRRRDRDRRYYGDRRYDYYDDDYYDEGGRFESY